MHEVMNESLNETIRGFEKIWSGSKFEVQERGEKEEDCRAGPAEKRAAGYRKILDSIDESVPVAPQPRHRLPNFGTHKRSDQKTSAAQEKFAFESSEKQPTPLIALHLDSKSSKSPPKPDTASFRPPLASIASPRRLFPADRDGSTGTKQRLFQTRANSKERLSFGPAKSKPADRPSLLLTGRDREVSASASHLITQQVAKPQGRPSVPNSQQLAGTTGARPSRQSKENRRPSHSQRDAKKPADLRHSVSRPTGPTLQLQPDSPKKQQPCSQQTGVTSKLDRFSRQVCKLSSNFDVVVMAIGGRGGRLSREFEADVKNRMDEIEALVRGYLRKLEEGQEAMG